MKIEYENEGINKNYILVLLFEDNTLKIDKINYSENFKNELEILSNLCKNPKDNVFDVVNYIKTSFVSQKLTKKQFNFCLKLDDAYQSVHVNVNAISDQLNIDRLKKYQKFFNEINNSDTYLFIKEVCELKVKVLNQMFLWVKGFDIECAYEKAKENSNVRAYSHKISGWSFPNFQITENLEIKINTNFGYGSASYFFVTLVYCGIEITPFSEWIDYRFSFFSHIIRYSKSFRVTIPKFNIFGEFSYFKILISDQSWNNALIYVRDAGNLLLSNESEFVKLYIISECEKMIKGLVDFKNSNFHSFWDYEALSEDQIKFIKQKRYDMDGFELINFRAEKIIGALDFLIKLREYEKIISTIEYQNIIIELSHEIIPNVIYELELQTLDLQETNESFDLFKKEKTELLNKNEMYLELKSKLNTDFQKTYSIEYELFLKEFEESKSIEKKYENKIKLHTANLSKLNNYRSKYYDFFPKI